MGKSRKSCDTCQHWSAGDPMGKIENMGVCTILMRNLETAPYWANDLIHVTKGWEGNWCPTYKGKLR